MKDLVIRNRKITAQDLPVIQAVINKHWSKGRTTVRIHVDQTPIKCTLAELGPVRVEMVRYTEHEHLYNRLVDQFHYLITHSSIDQHPRLLNEIPRGTRRYNEIKRCRSASE